MCDALTASIAFSALSTASQYQGQKQNANAQRANQQAQATENQRFMTANAKAANEAFFDQAAQENLRLTQVNTQQSQEIAAVQRDKLERQGTAQATSESAGTSLEMLMNDYNRAEGRYRNDARTQFDMEAQQAQMNIKGFRARAESRTNNVRPFIQKQISNPSLAGSLASFGASAASSYGTYKFRQAMLRKGR